MSLRLAVVALLALLLLSGISIASKVRWFDKEGVPPVPVDPILQNIEAAFQDKYGVLLHMTTWGWNKFLESATTWSDFILEPAYTVLQSNLPVSVYRFSFDPCPSLGLLFDGSKLKDFYLCLSSVDRDSSSRSCCGCGDGGDPFCNEPIQGPPPPYQYGWDTGMFYALSDWQTPPHWKSPYCPLPGVSCESSEDVEKCKEIRSGCGPHMWELLEELCPDLGAVANGSCKACVETRWDAYGTQPSHTGELIVPGVQDHAHQSIYRGGDWDLFMRRTKALADSTQKNPSQKLQIHENEVSIYIDADVTTSTYRATQKALTDALLAVLFVPQDCQRKDVGEALKVSCDASRELSRIMQRPIPCVEMTVESSGQVSLYDPDQPIHSLRAPPYNLRVVACT